MDKEKEIEKLQTLMLQRSNLANVEPVFIDENGNEYTIDNEKALKVLNDILEQAFIPFLAEQIINAGYGNFKQAIKEFAENAVNPIIDELVELLFNDNEPDCKVDCEKGSDVPCGSSICIDENKQYWKRKVDKLIKEVYGDEEDKN